MAGGAAGGAPRNLSGTFTSCSSELLDFDPQLLLVVLVACGDGGGVLVGAAVPTVGLILSLVVGLGVGDGSHTGA